MVSVHCGLGFLLFSLAKVREQTVHVTSIGAEQGFSPAFC